MGFDPSDASSSPATVYENAKDFNIDGWDIYDVSPTGATITNVFDIDRQSQVIELTGAGWTNGYRLRNADFSNWTNTSQFVIEWSMNYNEAYIVIVKVSTTAGTRYLRYEAVNTDALGTGRTIYYGLGGSITKDGQWHTYIRDLQADLSLAQPGATILSVNYMMFRGSGRVDDIKLHSNMPANFDSDGDGISDSDELSIYSTNANNVDTDGDTINDGDELTYWGNDWDIDFDQDGLNNLIDADADGDGYPDGLEISLGFDPSDASSSPATVYENAKDFNIDGWDIYDVSPTGATITNVFDIDRQSQVIELTGAGWTNGYRLRNADFSNWTNTSQFVIEWSMNYNEAYIVIVKVSTTAGTRYLRYEAVNTDALGTGRTIYYGLGGSITKDGQWHTYIRDLQADLSLAQPGATILSVNYMMFRGSGRVDDIKLRD